MARNLVLLASLNARYAGRSYDSFRGSADGPRQAMGDNATLDMDLGLRRGPSQIDLFVQNLADGRAIIWTGHGLSTDRCSAPVRAASGFRCAIISDLSGALRKNLQKFVMRGEGLSQACVMGPGGRGRMPPREG
jgi:hypothetical protein